MRDSLMKKILVISNACFSNIDSNGRTLAKLFLGYPKESLAQFCVYGTPDFEVCENYYKISDSAAIKSLLTLKAKGGVLKKEDFTETSSSSPYKGAGNKKKKPLMHLLRELIWSLNMWQGKSLKSFIKDFDPECIFLFLGNNAFLVNFARQIAEKINIPIIVYSTEDYYFKDYNYISKRPSVFYWLLRKLLVSSYKKAEPFIKKGLFNTPKLTQRYADAFKYPCYTVFAKSDIDFIENYKVPESDFKVSYLGNLGLNRQKALSEVADALSSIIPGAKLDVYGKCSKDVEMELKENPNINYMGFVGYEDVVKIIHQSNLLIHAEFNDPLYLKDLQAAFSTKIADSVCSGTPFFMYADSILAGTDFLLKNNCAFVACNKENLKGTLKTALLDEKARQEIIKNAEIIREDFFISQKQISDLL